MAWLAPSRPARCWRPCSRPGTSGPCRTGPDPLSSAIPVPFGGPLPPQRTPNGTGMGVPTPAPGVGTFVSPSPGPPGPPGRAHGPVSGAAWPRAKVPITLGQGRTAWSSGGYLTDSPSGVNSPCLPGVMQTRDREQSPGPWLSISRGDDGASEGGPRALGPRDEEPEPPAPPGHGGDPEQPDPRRIATPPDFGRELTLARNRAGLTVREVARAVGIPASTAGDYFAGRHLPPPSQPGLLPRILRVFGETDP